MSDMDELKVRYGKFSSELDAIRSEYARNGVRELKSQKADKSVPLVSILDNLDTVEQLIGVSTQNDSEFLIIRGEHTNFEGLLKAEFLEKYNKEHDDLIEKLYTNVLEDYQRSLQGEILNEGSRVDNLGGSNFSEEQKFLHEETFKEGFRQETNEEDRFETGDKEKVYEVNSWSGVSEHGVGDEFGFDLDEIGSGEVFEDEDELEEDEDELEDEEDSYEDDEEEVFEDEDELEEDEDELEDEEDSYEDDEEEVFEDEDSYEDDEEEVFEDDEDSYEDDEYELENDEDSYEEDEDELEEDEDDFEDEEEEFEEEEDDFEDEEDELEDDEDELEEDEDELEEDEDVLEDDEDEFEEEEDELEDDDLESNEAGNNLELDDYEDDDYEDDLEEDEIETPVDEAPKPLSLDFSQEPTTSQNEAPVKKVERVSSNKANAKTSSDKAFVSAFNKIGKKINK